MFKETEHGIVFSVKIAPKASKSAIVGWENNALKIRLAAVPQKGEANKQLIRFMADYLSVGRSNIKIISGETSAHKRLCISGITLSQLQALLPL